MPFNPAHWPVVGQLLLAFALGSLAVLAYAPFDVGLLMLPVVGGLLYLWRYAARPAIGFWLGYAFGLGLMGFGVFWIRISISQFGGVPMALAVVITLLFVAFMAVYYGLTGWLVGKLRTRNQAVWFLLVAPATWVLVEWLRGWLFTGFPWLALGYSQIDLPLNGFGPILGSYGITLVLLVSAGLLNLLPRITAIVAFVLLWALGFGLQHWEWTAPVGEPFQVSLLQGNIEQARKWEPSMRQQTLRRYLDMTESVPDSRIVIWPETAVPAFASEAETHLLAPIHAQLTQQGRDVLLGIVDGKRDGDYYNAMLSLGVSGRDRYYKRHLVPFGEYLPFDEWTRPVLDFMQIPMSSFAAGDDSKPLVMLAGYPVGVDICYEDAYGEEIIRALPEAALLVNASNDAWFGDSLAPHQHLEIARMRSLETGRYMLRSTNTGVSAIINHKGALVSTSPQFKQHVLTDEVVPMSGTTLFAYWGNWAVVLLSLLMLLPGFFVQRAD